MGNSPSRIFAAFFIFVMLCSFTLASDDLKKSDDSKSHRDPPVLINYQGVLNDQSGTPLVGTFDMIFRIYESESKSRFEWQESYTAAAGNAITTDSGGVFNVILNSTGTAAGNLATLVHNPVLWLEIQVENETLAPRQRLTSAAYTLSAPWSGLTSVPSGFSDGVDDISDVGGGLVQSGNILSIQDSYRLPQNAQNGQVATWNSSLSQWEPGNAGASYSSGVGLTLTGTEFSVVFAGSGSATTASRSDHEHGGAQWDTAAEKGLTVRTSCATGLPYGIIGEATDQYIRTTGVLGKTDSSTALSAGVFGSAAALSGQTYGVYGSSQSTYWYSAGVIGEGAIGVAGAMHSGGTAGVYGQGDSTGYGVFSQGNAGVDGDLTVTGNIELAGNLVNNPVKTGYCSVSPSAIVCSDESMNFQRTVGEFSRENGNTGIDEDKAMWAHFDIPHGATITGVKLSGYTDIAMGLSTGQTNLRFQLIAIRDVSYTILLSFTDQEMPDVSEYSRVNYQTGLSTPHLVDNQTEAYHIRIAAHIGFDFRKCTITYQY